MVELAHMTGPMKCLKSSAEPTVIFFTSAISCSLNPPGACHSERGA
jgi:hypothetical protein